MEKNKTSKKESCVWPIRMPKKLKDEFKTYCDKKGFSMNKRINILIKNDIEYE